MGKISLWVALMALVCGAFAQNDTVRWYGTNRYLWPTMCQHPDPVGETTEGPGFQVCLVCGLEHGARFTVNKANTIYGLAFPLILTSDGFDVRIQEFNTVVALWEYDSVGRLQTTVRDTFPGQVVQSSVHYDLLLDDSTMQMPNGQSVWPMVELYFDSPIVVGDTFFMGYWLPNPVSRMLVAYPACVAPSNWTYWPEGLIAFPPYTRDDTVGFVSAMPYWFPIIAPYNAIEDTISYACQVPDIPTLNFYDGTLAFIQWQRPSDSHGLELALGTAIGDPDLNPINALPSDQTGQIFSGLQPGHFYDASLRNICRHQCNRHDTSWYSAWSAPLVFYLPISSVNDTSWLGDTAAVVGGSTIIISRNLIELDGNTFIIIVTDTLSVSDPRIVIINYSTCILDGTLIHTGNSNCINTTSVSEIIRLYPNPTNGVLSVECGEWNVESIEIYDIQGRLVLQQPKEPQNLKTSKPNNLITLNLQSLAPGTYILQATAPEGTARKAFVKE